MRAVCGPVGDRPGGDRVPDQRVVGEQRIGEVERATVERTGARFGGDQAVRGDRSEIGRLVAVEGDAVVGAGLIEGQRPC